MPKGKTFNSKQLCRVYCLRQMERLRLRQDFTEYETRIRDRFQELMESENYYDEDFLINAKWVRRGGPHRAIVLRYAAEKGCDRIVNVLLKSGVEFNNTDNYGQTALMFAAQDGHLKCLDLLLKAKADVNKKDNTGQTALMFAIASGSRIVLTYCYRCLPNSVLPAGIY